MDGDVQAAIVKTKTTMIQEFVILIPNILYFIVGWKNTPRDNSILGGWEIA